MCHGKRHKSNRNPRRGSKSSRGRTFVLLSLFGQTCKGFDSSNQTYPETNEDKGQKDAKEAKSV